MMKKRAAFLFDDSPMRLKARVAFVFAVLIAANIAVWTWALVAFRDYPLLLGTAALAYSFGLRHAFDADHIAAIDNTTRKLIQDGERPLSVGFWFSLGHSTVVFLLAFLLSIGITSLSGPVSNDNSGLHQVTGSIGTLVSGTFLYGIAGMNVVILVGIIKVFREMKSGKYDEQALEEQLNNRGFMNRFLGRITRAVTRSHFMKGR